MKLHVSGDMVEADMCWAIIHFLVGVFVIQLHGSAGKRRRKVNDKYGAGVIIITMMLGPVALALALARP